MNNQEIAELKERYGRAITANVEKGKLLKKYTWNTLITFFYKI